MKKIYALASCAILTVSSLSARELKFFEGDKEIPSGSKIEYTDYTSAPGRPGYVELTFNPEIYLWSDITMSVTVTAKCITGQSIQLCAGGKCEVGSEITKEKVKVNGNEKLDIKFEYISEQPEAEAVPVVVTEISAFDPDRSNIKSDFTITFNSVSGVSTVFANDDSFRAVTGGIEYSFETPTPVEIYSLSGETVYSGTLNGNGTISTHNLAPGIYAYKAGSKTGKIYLR